FITFLYVVIAILAFIMAITTSNTITKEANVIGTLRASGYTRGELIRHYLSMPALVTLISAVIGNIVGYTLFVEVALGIYYGNYSLPLFDILWNADAFVQTTVIPVLLMIAINFFILSSKMKLSPLKFIRRDLKKNGRKKALRLNTKIGIMHRFRIRVILQNLPNYIMIVVGIFLANVILLLGMGFPKLLENNETLIAENMICDYQCILKAPVETENDSAEKYCAGGLMTIEGRRKSEAVTIYGISSDSSYFDIEFGEGVFISEAFAAKNSIEIGDTVTMKEEFGTKEYSFTVDGISGSPTTLAVYMERSYFNEVFGNETDYFNGYFSDEELTDIDELYIMNKLTIDDFTKLSRQMNNSMGEVFDMFYWFGLVMFMLIIYLLSKIIIEKNAQSISMTKILGYTNSEISGLYVITTSIVVIASFILTMPIVDVIMRILCAEIFAAYAGWIPYSVPASVYVTIIAMGIAAYAVIAFLQFRRVKKIPLDTALKNVE
ncbi:MAG: ABC transporter permease, partial [Oscillospiraceae bacterium]|nr:ABC transporter permease [Oscillospiraceae bacterium]